MHCFLFVLFSVESRFRPRTGELAQLRRELESFYEHRRVAEGGGYNHRLYGWHHAQVG